MPAASLADRTALLDEAVAIIAPSPEWVEPCRLALAGLVDRYLAAHAAWKAAPRPSVITGQIDETERLCRELADHLSKLDPLACDAIAARFHRKGVSTAELPPLPAQLLAMSECAAEAAAFRRGVIEDPKTGKFKPAADRGGNTRGPGFRRPETLLVAWLAELLDLFDRREAITGSPNGAFATLAGLLHEAAFGEVRDMSNRCKAEAPRWQRSEPPSFPQG